VYLDEANEITLTEGENITDIVCVDEGWWQGTNSSGQTGLFPANYVQVIDAGSLVRKPTYHFFFILCYFLFFFLFLVDFINSLY